MGGRGLLEASFPSQISLRPPLTIPFLHAIISAYAKAMTKDNACGSPDRREDGEWCEPSGRVQEIPFRAAPLKGIRPVGSDGSAP